MTEGKTNDTRHRKQESDKTRRETIAKYYLDLSKLTFAALVLGSLTPLFTTQKVNLPTIIVVMCGGIATTVILEKIGNRILKG